MQYEPLFVVLNFNPLVEATRILSRHVFDAHSHFDKSIISVSYY
jgi:hypothetical protein